MGALGRLLLVAAIGAGLALPPAGPAWASCHTAFFDPTTYEVAEGAGHVVLTVQNPGPAPNERTVDYATAGGTARPGTDFEARSGTLTFSPTATTKTITVEIANDTVHEGTEAFTVGLTAREGSCIQDLTQGKTATVTIADNDAAPSASTQPKSTVNSKPTSRSTVRAGPTSSPSPRPRKSAKASPSENATPIATPRRSLAAPYAQTGGGSRFVLAGILAAIGVLAGAGALWMWRRSNPEY
jgi:Calx-beta domain-containing protein